MTHGCYGVLTRSSAVLSQRIHFCTFVSHEHRFPCSKEVVLYLPWSNKFALNRNFCPKSSKSIQVPTSNVFDMNFWSCLCNTSREDWRVNFEMTDVQLQALFLSLQTYQYIFSVAEIICFEKYSILICLLKRVSLFHIFSLKINSFPFSASVPTSSTCTASTPDKRSTKPCRRC